MLGKFHICIVTGTRAEYHLLYPLIVALNGEDIFEVKLAVTGSHLSDKYGNTYQDILADGISIDYRIPILEENDDESGINRAMSNAILGFDEVFSREKPDLVILLGDRYELLSVAIVCMNYKVPIAHLHGGEITKGANDESIRHSISKMSYLHFTSCELYRKRVIQLGESPSRVFNVGAIGLENIRKVRRMTLPELQESVKFDLKGEFGVFTFHPVTLENKVTKHSVAEIFKALDNFPDLKIIFTKSNADAGGLLINEMIDKYVEENPDRCVSVYSLGMRRYLSALSFAKVIIGNSSSGIIETPSFGVPTVNIGDRQKGRIRADNIIDCEHDETSIQEAINHALSDEFQRIAHQTVSPYGDGYVTDKILAVLYKFFEGPGPELKKEFYDIL